MSASVKPPGVPSSPWGVSFGGGSLPENVWCRNAIVYKAAQNKVGLRTVYVHYDEHSFNLFRFGSAWNTQLTNLFSHSRSLLPLSFFLS